MFLVGDAAHIYASVGGGPVRIVYEIGRLGFSPVPSRISVHRALLRAGLITPGVKRRRREEYRRWERDAAMALGQTMLWGRATFPRFRNAAWALR